MIQKLKTLILSAVVIATPLLVAGTASASISDSLCQGANLSASTGTCTNTGTTSDFQSVLSNIINIFSLIIGVVAVIMIIYGGFKYITSGGNDQNVGAAKNTILYAVIGLVVVAFAQFIVHFVLNNAKVGSS